MMIFSVKLQNGRVAYECRTFREANQNKKLNVCIIRFKIYDTCAINIVKCKPAERIKTFS